MSYADHLPFDCRYSAGSPAWKARMATHWNRVNTERARRLVAGEHELGDRVAMSVDLARLLTRSRGPRRRRG